MTTKTIRFILEAVPSSEYDLWQPVKGGASKVRPKKITTRYWPGHSKDTSKVRELSESLWREFGLPNDSGWTTIDLDSPKLPLLVRRLQELKEAGAVYPVRGLVEIRLVDNPDDPCPWFELFTLNDVRHISGTTCKADRALPGVHVDGLHVSERFKTVVEENGFRGIEFLWLRDEGKYAAPQWYRAIPLEPIGRGLDHEFFNSATLDGGPYFQSTTPTLRNGTTSFRREQLKSPTPFAESIQNDLIAMFPPNERSDGLNFRAYRQHLVQFLPQSDFAYAWSGGFLRLLCFKRAVRDAFIKAGVVTEEECRPIKVWDQTPAGAEILDQNGAPYPSACPKISDEELARQKREAQQAWTIHLQNPKPKRETDLPKALELLRAAKNAKPGNFEAEPQPGDVGVAAQVLGASFPEAWREVLRVADAFEIYLGGIFYVAPPNRLVEFNESIQSSARAGYPTFPSHLLHITTGFSGDFHSLDLSTLTPDGDCRVLQFDHETFQPEREWDSIASFIQEICDSMETSEQ